MIHASIGQRIQAHFLDVLVLMTVAGAIVYIGSRNQPLEIALTPVRGLLLFVYTWYCHAKFGHTLGKKWSGIGVVRCNGGRIGYARSALRQSPFLVTGLAWSIATVIAIDRIPPEVYLAMWGHGISKLEATLMPEWIEPVEICFGIVCFISLLTIAMTRQRRALHDYLGGTLVISTDKPGEKI